MISKLHPRSLLLTAAVLGLTACQSADTQLSAPEQAPTNQRNEILTDGFAPNLSAAELSTLCDEVFTSVEARFQTLEADTSPATLTSVVGAFDEVLYELQELFYTYHIKFVHPDAEIREAATNCSIRIDDFFAMVALSRGYYDRLVAIDASSLDGAEAFMLSKAIRDYELAGVNRDEATRDRIRALQQEITEIGNAFDRNIREDVRYVDTTVAGLDGLPQDYIDAHPADDNGVVRLSTDYPDLVPVLTYAHNDDLRRDLRTASRSRGYPVNEEVLSSLIAKRHELAQLLGFNTFAELSMKDKMIGHPDKAIEFLAAIREAVQQPLEREMGVFLRRMREIDPDADTIQAWQYAYLANLLRQEDYALDSKLVRTYFTYERVRDGIFQLTEDLFGVTIEPWETETWHEDVETYQITENGQLLSRFYMDNHSRPDKYKHAAHWSIRVGVKDRQIPLSALAQNFPKGLMEHSQVETFLHEFGHLLHNAFSATQTWPAIAGMSMERDFVEAPSQMLEEWIWDYDTLKTFAINEAGEAIPRDLVARMNKARDFGKASGTGTQIYYARLSLDYYNQVPGFDLDKTMIALAEEYSPFPYVQGTHFWSNFSHLNGYSSNYYTYQWSLAIATDLFSRFAEEGMRNTETAKDYRSRVLGAAGSKPAEEFVKDFLGRDFSPDAYINWLEGL